MELNEKCGVFGIYSNDDFDVARSVYYGLWTLQHRGQEASGIASSNGQRIRYHKGKGLVAHVYSEENLKKLVGNIAVGHNRYATFGKTNIDHSQPVCQDNNTIALCHNGNLPVVTKLKSYLKSKGIPVHGLNDSEMMFKAIEHWVVKRKPLHEAIKECYGLFQGAFSVLVMAPHELVAFRDPYGIRPLSIGTLNNSYVFSSETCALDALGAKYLRDVEPGEMVVVNKNGLTSYQLTKGELKLDLFEFIYFARPDSTLLGKNVYEVRKNLGKQLAKEVNLKPDIIVPVPDSSIPAAIGYSQELGLPLEQALVKNRYIHRTFITPSQRQREVSIKTKLNVIKEAFKGKSVGIVDDSIVRGSTMRTISKMIRECGAKEVHVLIPSPPVKYPDFYGIDTPDQKDLIAVSMTKDELKVNLGVDSINYISYPGMIKAIGISEESLCTACFTGDYPCDIGSNRKKIQFFD